MTQEKSSPVPTPRSDSGQEPAASATAPTSTPAAGSDATASSSATASATSTAEATASQGASGSEPGAAPPPHRTALDLADAVARQVEMEPALPVKARLQPFILAGGLLIGLTFFGFGGWAAVAPLNSAAIANGKVVVEGNLKAVQHLEGGIIKDILVKDGDVVQPGQVLIRLDDTRARAVVENIRKQMDDLRAREARLVAERDGLDGIPFPKDILTRRATTPYLEEMIEVQTNLFRARQEATRNRVEMLRSQINQLKEEITGLQAQKRSVQRQINLLDKELKDKRGLAARGIVKRNTIVMLERELAKQQGALGEAIANIARTRQKIAEAEVNIIDQTTKKLNEAVSGLEEVGVRLATLEESLRANEDVLRRVEIRSPHSGVVVGLNVHTSGGVISPGDKLMDIVPQDKRLIIEAEVKPTDIDVVHAGLPAEVRFSPFNARRTPSVLGKVVDVSADLVKEKGEKENREYYRALIELDEAVLKEKLREERLYPGMPAQVMIVTGERTALEYIITPFAASIDRAFRED